ncbi:metallophosphoesterase [Paenibacillus xerothermodurans]|uniref:Metallophosphoesterase n=1 Tax=Paenibacillus xerothermodurans TaxID=1977292 RepID=A0A2W1P2Y5_PAEXE|nr:metallophosphoesterase [Paenibacillus xerothermodurans]PZE22092.1 metallophosphoesterase [Paenibacillus xerothermodurans]
MNTQHIRTGQKLMITLAVICSVITLVWLVRWTVFDKPGVRQLSAEDTSFSLSLDDGDFVQGSKTILATASSAEQEMELLIDGIKAPLKPVMEQQALLTLEVSDLESGNGYVNAVWFNGARIHTFNENMTTFTKVLIPVPADLLKPGENEVIMRSGSTVSPEDEAMEHDDWRFRSLKFELGDGTVLEAPAYNTSTTYVVGDGSPSSRLPNSLEKRFTFTIKDEKFRAYYHIWDTRQLPEGAHQVELIADEPTGKKSKAVTVQVDNTAPSVQIVSPAEGNTYKNSVNISLKVNDAGSGTADTVVKLDGKVIVLPEEVLTEKLTAGAHKLEVMTSDKAGNETEAAVSFQVIDEMPKPPLAVHPADLSVVDADRTELSVQVSDTADDALDVSFYKARRFDLGQAVAHAAFSHAADREPPLQMVLDGENALSAAERSLVASRDGQYLVNNDKERFPYHRFSIEVGDNLTGDDEVVWSGHSLPERLVTMYLWNHDKSVWEDMDSNKGTEDFTLHGKLSPPFIRNGRVEVLIQDRIPTAEDYDFAFLWMSDTQYYAEKYPNIFDRMIEWAVANWKQRKLSYLIHTGDIVNNWNSKEEWERASGSMRNLDDAGIPYGVVAGNHDVAYDAGIYDDYWKYFGRDRFIGQPTFSGDLNNNRDHYDLVSVNGNDFVIIYLGWLIDQKTFDWADAVLKKHADRNAIIATHEYLKPNKAYYGQGQQIWDELVVPNSNVFMVLGGHNPGVAHNVKKIGDRHVLEMLSDYQNGPEGGQGFMRLLQFDLGTSQLFVNTYSPYLNKHNFFKPEDDELVLPITLKPIEKQVATDYIAVYSRTHDLIGEVHEIPSGGTATVAYHGLAPGQTHHWFAVARDQYGGQSRSEVYSFHTK